MKTRAAKTFVKQGLLLTQFQVSPACSPTRSTLMLGSCKFHKGVAQTIPLRDRPNLDATALAQMLQSSG
ncbi:MAG: hypothetical protein GY819_17100 [Planctomycetaceae bacterium]|nr:hypothetical protein [Planctomycetaceae bacterium]